MSKKNVSVDELSNAALDAVSQDNPAETPEADEIVRIGVNNPLCFSGRSFGFDKSYRSVGVSAGAPIVYPKSKTDQIHALSIADMIRQGQGAVTQEPSDYDLKPGERDNGSIEPHDMSELEWADPAERFETEQKMNEEFVKNIVPVQKVTTQKDTTSSEEPKTGQNEPDNGSGV